MPVPATSIGDLMTLTLSKFERLRFNQIATRLVNYEVMGSLLRKDKVQMDSGAQMVWFIMTDHSGAAKMTALYGVDSLNVADVMKQITVPWRHSYTHYAMEERERMMNADPSKIVDLMQVRRTDAMISLVELMEAQFWSKPADSTDIFNTMGVPYWVVEDTTQVAGTAGGFNGLNPAGFPAGAGGLDSTTTRRWANWTDKYRQLTKFDGIKRMKRAMRNINFKSPVNTHQDYSRGGPDHRVYCGEESYAEFEDVGEGQNDNLGKDIAPTPDGGITFKRNPIIRIPILDGHSLHPIYMLNFQWFYPVFLRGDYLRETGPKPAPYQHNVQQVFIDCTWNTCCTDRREQAVLIAA